MKYVRLRTQIKDTQYYNKLIFHIQNSEILDWVELICEQEQANTTYGKATSSSKRWHPKICNGVGGLFHHTKLCCLIAQRLIALYRPMGRLTDEDLDIIYASLILHDLWKYVSIKGEQTKGTQFEHGYIAYLNLQKYVTGEPWQDRILEAVRFHMSNWCHTDEEITLAQETDSLVNQIIMIADMIASEPKIIEYIEGDEEN